MCIAILNKKGIIPDAYLKESWDTNKDGAGFAYVHRKKMVIFKTLTDYPLFLSEYKKAKEIAPKSNFLIHFRIATQGGVNLENCHPFLVNDSLAMIHNGMLRNTPNIPLRSDTNFLAHTILAKMGKGIEYDPEFKHICEIFTSTFGNKLVFLNTNNDCFIINESLGHWLDGNWYSNYSYKSYTQYSYRETDYEPRGNTIIPCTSCKTRFLGSALVKGKCWQCRTAVHECEGCLEDTKNPINMALGGRYCDDCLELIKAYA